MAEAEFGAANGATSGIKLIMSNDEAIFERIKADIEFISELVIKKSARLNIILSLVNEFRDMFSEIEIEIVDEIAVKGIEMKEELMTEVVIVGQIDVIIRFLSRDFRKKICFEIIVLDVEIFFLMILLEFERERASRGSAFDGLIEVTAEMLLNELKDVKRIAATEAFKNFAIFFETGGIATSPVIAGRADDAVIASLRQKFFSDELRVVFETTEEIFGKNTFHNKHSFQKKTVINYNRRI